MALPLPDKPSIAVMPFLNMTGFSYFHGIWHLFVLAGSAIHYIAIVLYVA